MKRKASPVADAGRIASHPPEWVIASQCETANLVQHCHRILWLKDLAWGLPEVLHTRALRGIWPLRLTLSAAGIAIKDR